MGDQVENKIYYSFAYDPDNVLTLIFKEKQQVNVSIVRALLIVTHNIQKAAMCTIELRNSDNIDIVLRDEDQVTIGSKLYVFRRPVKSPKDQISDLLKSLQEEPERYGLQKEEINRIISDNTGKELQKFVDDLKLKNLISEDI